MDKKHPKALSTYTGKPFSGIKRRPVTILKPGTVDPTETMRRLRGR
jgi:hypothetical protein